MCKDVDVVVLAQASMARVADTLLDREHTVPILSSPRLGMLHVVELLSQLSEGVTLYRVGEDPKRD